MIRQVVLALGLLAGAATPALAEAPATSLRPMARASTEPAAAVEKTETTETAEKAVMVSARDAASQEVAQADTTPRKGLFRALRPKPRSARVQLFAGKKKRELQQGAVCGDIALQGDAIGRVASKVSGCGVDNAVRLRSVSGIPLTQQSVMDCGTARALKSWVDKGLVPAVGRKGGGVARIKVAAHYACRPRNNQKGARISEHGKGRAIDISAFYLANGTEVSVLKDWGKGWAGKALKAMHARACGPFGTVLGPNANRFHRDHFHFDTARYRSGTYCK